MWAQDGLVLAVRMAITPEVAEFLEDAEKICKAGGESALHLRVLQELRDLGD
jgi:hypothetical protein